MSDDSIFADCRPILYQMICLSDESPADIKIQTVSRVIHETHRCCVRDVRAAILVDREDDISLFNTRVERLAARAKLHTVHKRDNNNIIIYFITCCLLFKQNTTKSNIS